VSLIYVMRRVWGYHQYASPSLGFALLQCLEHHQIPTISRIMTTLIPTPMAALSPAERPVESAEAQSNGPKRYILLATKWLWALTCAALNELQSRGRSLVMLMLETFSSTGKLALVK
jgi:hypothetical protein